MSINLPKYGAYSKDIILARPDRRTREGRLVRQFRVALYEHLGGEARLSVTQRSLVERACMLQLRLALLDQKMVDGRLSAFDGKEYIAWANALRRALVALGLEGHVDKRPTLDEHLAALAARQGDAAA